MKKVIALIVVIMGMVLMNSPPVSADQFTQTDETVLSIDMDQFGTMEIMVVNVDVSYLGGFELKLPLAAWTATIDGEIDNLLVIMESNFDKLQNSLDQNAWLMHSLGQNTMINHPEGLRPEANSLAYTNRQGPSWLEIYEHSATWRFQETYM